MSERDARRPEVRLTPPPRISAVAPKRAPRKGAGAPTSIAPERRAGRPGWALPVAFGLLGAVALGGYLLVKRAAPPQSAAESAPRVAPIEAPNGAVASAPARETAAEPASAGDSNAGEQSPNEAVSESNALEALGGTRSPEPAQVASASAPPPPAPSPSPAADDALFGRELAAGLAAIESDDWPAASVALDRAEAVRPGAPEIAEARARVAAGATRSALDGHLAGAQQALDSERWRDAARELNAALAIDPTLTRARQGLETAEERAEMSELIEYHLAHPDRLASAAVLAEAEELLEEASEIASPGERHRRQAAALEELLATARVPIRVSLHSDQQTEVTVYKVGRLGTFSWRELELRPGLYTVVGSRKGYRDVRHQLRVRPGSSPEPLVVRCEEKI